MMCASYFDVTEEYVEDETEEETQDLWISYKYGEDGRDEDEPQDEESECGGPQVGHFVTVGLWKLELKILALRHGYSIFIYYPAPNYTLPIIHFSND
jgi:hypothetical protein